MSQQAPRDTLVQGLHGGRLHAAADDRQIDGGQDCHKLRRQNAAAFFPVIDPDVLAARFRARVGNEKARKPIELGCEIVSHAFPRLKMSSHGTTTAGKCNSIYVASPTNRRCVASCSNLGTPVDLRSACAPILNSNLDSKSALASETRADAATSSHFSFAGELHPRSETAAQANASPGPARAADNSARLA